MRYSLALGVVLDDLPVLLDRDIDVAQLDLPLLDLFNLGEPFPLNRENQTVAAARINVGDNPDVLHVCRHDFLESLQC